jgi:hypothetical protein
MNERIRELAEQATSIVEMVGPEGYTSSYAKFDREKFAELIVRECIGKCEPVLDEPYEDMSEFGKGLVEGQDVAVEKIKQHFGVEK